jgi:DNA-binding SARP family transcriptional activator
MLELGLLGPVWAARAGRELPLGGPRQRAVLALLAVEAGQVVPAGRLRLAVLEARIEADLALGLHAEVVGELDRLVAEHPVRERMWQLLVLALYRAGRKADAWAACRRARAMLAEELGKKVMRR